MAQVDAPLFVDLHDLHRQLVAHLHDLQQIGELLQFLIAHQVDGVIIASSHDDVYSYVTSRSFAVPIVLLGDCMNASCGTACNAVSLDNYTAGRIGAEYLIGLGHRDIVYLGRRANSATHQHRYAGYAQAMQAAGLTPNTVDNPDNARPLRITAAAGT